MGQILSRTKLLCSLGVLNCLQQQRSNLEQVAADADVSNFEDRSGLVLVNSNDELGFLHASQMLDSTGDAQSNIHLGMDSLTSLTT